MAIFGLFLVENAVFAYPLKSTPEVGKTMQELTTRATRHSFGKTREGEDVQLVVLRNKQGVEARVIDFGATLIGMDVPDRTGTMTSVVLGFDNIGDYETKSPYFGATVGRCANRIAGAQFDLNGTTYKLAANNGANSLHGGLKGFDKRVWIR